MLSLPGKRYSSNTKLIKSTDFSAEIFVHARNACRDMGASLATVYDNGVNDWLTAKMSEWIHPSDTVSLTSQ